MITRRSACALLAAVLLGGAANAQVPVVYGQPLYGRVAAEVGSFSLDEIVRPGGYGPMTRGGQGIGGTVVRQLPKVGRFVGYGGLFALGGAAVYGALNWFYEEAKRSTGTGLDDWWSPRGYPSPRSINEYSPTGGGVCNYQTIVDGKVRYNTRYLISTNPSSSTQNKSYMVAVISRTDGVDSNPIAITGDADSGEKALSYVGPCQTQPPTIAQVVGNDPAAADALRDVIAEYLSKNPQLIPPMFTPVPNANEIADDVVDPDLDTDGDGATDGDERPDRAPTVVPQPGNRPTPFDSPGSDPTNPNDKPLDTDKDGIPDWRDADDDNDGVPDDKEESPEAQKDPTKGPEDLDKDGVPDSADPDDDNDGVPDDKDPEPKNENVPKKCGEGYTTSEDGKSCVREKDPPKCPQGTRPNPDDPSKCDPDDDPETPANDDCGDFSVKRLMSHTGNYLRDVVFPCDEIADYFTPALNSIRSKFPFSLGSSLAGWFDGASSAAGDGGTNMPDKLGVIPLDWGWLAPLWKLIKTVVGVALWAWFVYWLVDRFAPRTVI